MSRESLRAALNLVLEDLCWDETGDGSAVAMLSVEQVNALRLARDTDAAEYERLPSGLKSVSRVVEQVMKERAAEVSSIASCGHIHDLTDPRR